MKRGRERGREEEREGDREGRGRKGGGKGEERGREEGKGKRREGHRGVKNREALNVTTAGMYQLRARQTYRLFFLRRHFLLSLWWIH